MSGGGGHSLLSRIVIRGRRRRANLDPVSCAQRRLSHARGALTVPARAVNHTGNGQL